MSITPSNLNSSKASSFPVLKSATAVRLSRRGDRLHDRRPLGTCGLTVMRLPKSSSVTSRSGKTFGG